VSSLLSIDDLFAVGVGCDLLGGWYLGRGLLVKPVEVVDRAATVTGANPGDDGGV